MDMDDPILNLILGMILAIVLASEFIPRFRQFLRPIARTVFWSSLLITIFSGVFYLASGMGSVVLVWAALAAGVAFIPYLASVCGAECEVNLSEKKGGDHANRS